MYAGLLAEQFLAKAIAIQPNTPAPTPLGIYAQDYFGLCAQLLARLRQQHTIDSWTTQLFNAYQMQSGRLDALGAALSQMLPKSIILESSAVQTLVEQLHAVAAPTTPSNGLSGVIEQTMSIWLTKVYATYRRTTLPLAQQEVQGLYENSHGPGSLATLA